MLYEIGAAITHAAVYTISALFWAVPAGADLLGHLRLRIRMMKPTYSTLSVAMLV